MLAVRSSGIRLICPPDYQYFVKQDLTIIVSDFVTGEKHKIYCYKEKPPAIWIPRHYPVPCHVTHVNYDVKSITVTSKITPRDDIQRQAISFLSKDLEDCILQLPPGTGKTVITIDALCKLGLKSLIIVDQRDLQNQWCQAISQFTNVVVKEDVKAEFKQPFSVVTIQKLLSMLRKDPVQTWKAIKGAKFGVVVFDEVHALIGPEQFTNVCFALPVPKYIALSATPYRLDDTGKILRYWTGNNKFTGGSAFKVTVIAYEFNSEIPDKSWRWITWGGKVNRQRYLKKLSDQKQYYDVLLAVVKLVLDYDRKVLVLVERVNIAKQLSNLLKKEGIDHGYYVGDKDRRELRQNVIIATYSKCTKAIDIPHIDTLIYGTPITNEIMLEQSKGRIQRLAPNKQPPLIIDLLDTSQFRIYGVKYMFERRMLYYQDQNFKVHKARNFDDIKSVLANLKKEVMG